MSVTPADARALVLSTVSEHDFQAAIRRWARLGGWLAYATYDSRRSVVGYPDLCLVHPLRRWCVFAENKSASGRLKPFQRQWLEALESVASISPRLAACVWRPADADAVQRFLLGDNDSVPGRYAAERRSP